ncbi:hypothetical protein ACHAWF_016648 [Thalassiosira exigua]
MSSAPCMLESEGDSEGGAASSEHDGDSCSGRPCTFGGAASPLASVASTSSARGGLVAAPSEMAASVASTVALAVSCSFDSRPQALVALAAPAAGSQPQGPWWLCPWLRWLALGSRGFGSRALVTGCFDPWLGGFGRTFNMMATLVLLSMATPSASDPASASTLGSSSFRDCRLGGCSLG